MKEEWLNHKFIYLQEWEGCIVEVRENSFLARLTDITNGDTDEEAEIFFEDVREEDRKYIKEGAVFYWDIGNLIKNGKKISMSIINFHKRKFTKKDFEKAKKRAEELFKKIKWK